MAKTVKSDAKKAAKKAAAEKAAEEAGGSIDQPGYGQSMTQAFVPFSGPAVRGGRVILPHPVI